MRVLLDTHPLLWYAVRPEELGRRAREVLDAPETERLLSPASAWELAIKVNIGKLKLGQGVMAFMESALATPRTTWLPMSLAHIARQANLPLHHRDPFDRLLIATALVEGVPVVTRDAAFQAYEGLTTIW